ncbi:MAG: transcriptional regulator [Archaeoglobaceae archaeon]|nr:transcriptional regulator [Archaeoglobaceae archaeon]MDK2876075.1 transcriptional regulator [Archaeoglobaceae archaeon]
MRIEEIISLLEEQPMTVRDICIALKLEPSQEKEVIESLKRISRVLKRKGKQLLVKPPICRKCGFEFENINPSKCPKCKSEWIEPARFMISVK